MMHGGNLKLTYSCVEWCCLGGSVFFPEPHRRQFLTGLFTHVCPVPHRTVA